MNVPTCPAWCTLPAGHDWDQVPVDGLGMLCGHGYTVGTVADVRVDVYADEYAVDDLPPVISEPVVVVTLPDDVRGAVELSAAESRALGGLLIRAAGEVDRIGER